MSTEPSVSLVVATYRSRRDHLAEAIGSALGQSRRDIEVIVSDDSPDDALGAVVASYGDARLRYRRNVPALGVARNHWEAFAEARGRYLVVLNHDDALAPQFVERLAAVLDAQPDIGVAFCDHWIIDADGRRLVADTDRASQTWGRAGLAAGRQPDFPALVGAQTLPIAMGAMFRRSALPAALPDDAGPAYDLWLAYLLCRSGGGAWYVPERLSAWRHHPANLTSEGGMAWLRGSVACWQAVAADDRMRAIHALARRKAASGHYSCAVRAWAARRRGACLHHALQSLRLRPSWKGALALALPLAPAAWAPARWQRGGAAA